MKKFTELSKDAVQYFRLIATSGVQKETLFKNQAAIGELHLANFIFRVNGFVGLSIDGIRVGIAAGLIR